MPLQQESERHDATPDQVHNNPLFKPSPEEEKFYGRYQLTNPRLLPKPNDVRADYIAYNPSGIYTVVPDNIDRSPHQALDIMYVRVEPNRVDSGTSHLGKAAVRPYIIDLQNINSPLRPFHDAMELPGEDPTLLRINRRLPLSGKVEKAWLLGLVDAQPKSDKPYEVASVQTKFYAGKSLDKLEQVAVGPAWMKDIRLAVDADPDSSKLHIWGRPQPHTGSGNISYTSVSDLSEIKDEIIAAAPLIHQELLPYDSGIWGGVNDAFMVGVGKYILAAHRARMTGPDNNGRHYESCLFGYNTNTNRIVDLGIVATADMFPGRTVKDDTHVDLHDVVFTGGGYNGRPELLTFGVGDGSIGIGNLVKRA